MGLRDKLKRLERAAEGEMVVIPQADGTTARFPTSAFEEAFLRNMDRLRGEDVPPHPLSVAIHNAERREQWHDTFYDMVEVNQDLEDLSE